MKRKLLWSLLVLPPLALAIPMLLNPTDPINRGNFRRIALGMTEARVERILGKAADWDGYQPQGSSRIFSETIDKLPKDGSVPGPFGVGWQAKCWLSSDRQRLVTVEFVWGRVVAAEYGMVLGRSGLLDRLRLLWPW